MLGDLAALLTRARRRLRGTGRAWPWLWPIRTFLLRPLQTLLTVLLALVLMFEEWGWQPLVRALGRLARWRPIAQLEAALARLPPYAALAAFALPAMLLLPFKLLAFWLLAHEAPGAAVAVFVAAKLVGTGLVGRIFLITRPQLMRIGWFRRSHDVLMPWKEAMFAIVRASRVWRWGRIVGAVARRRLGRLWTRWAG